MADSVTVDRGPATIDPRRAGTAGANDADPAGTLAIADRVGAKIAARAALGVDDVIRHRNTLGAVLSATGGRGVLGSDYPQVDVDMSDSAPAVRVAIAVRWPCRLTAVCVEVRRRVADDLARLTGVRPARVDVAVSHIATAQQLRRESGTGVRKGFIELPPVEGSGGGSGSPVGDTIGEPGSVRGSDPRTPGDTRTTTEDKHG